MSREGRLGVGLGVAGLALTVILPAGDALGIRLPRGAVLVSFGGGLLLLAIGVVLVIDAAVRPTRRKPPSGQSGIYMPQGGIVMGNILHGAGIQIGGPPPAPPPRPPHWWIRLWRWIRQ